jgi:hypothetical protein
MRLSENVEDHVGGTVTNYSVGVCPHVVKELINSLLGSFGRCSRLAGNIGEGH